MPFEVGCRRRTSEAESNAGAKILTPALRGKSDFWRRLRRRHADGIPATIATQPQVVGRHGQFVIQTLLLRVPT